MSLLPHQFWQSVHPAGTYSSDPGAGFIDSYPAELPDGRQVLLPVRVLPGDGNEAVHAIVVPQEGVTLTESEIVEHARQRIAGYKRPRSFSFIAEDEMPRTATGKILHRVLRQRFGNIG